MLMCDIDYFKKLNDHLGHAEGDRCLVEVARIIQDNIRRDCDPVARYGVLLPGVNEDEAYSVGERIRVEAAVIHNPGSRMSRRVTIGIGVAVQTADEVISPEELQRPAGEALYRAKRAGRNRVFALRTRTFRA